MYNERELHAVLATDFLAFLEMVFETVSPGDRFKDNWHIQAIARQLEKIERGLTRRLIVTMPPRHLKSITISVAWVAWMLGRDPTRKFVCASYAAELALKHARDCRAVMQSAWYRQAFPETIIERVSENDFTTTRKGGRLSTSVGGVMTGRGGSIIVIDDPMKPDEAPSVVARKNVKQWYQRTVSSRLDDKNEGAVVVVMQRLHEDDLAGNLLETEGVWEHLNLPAIAESDDEIEIAEGEVHRRSAGDVLQPGRESREVLDATRREMGSANFSAQYQQAPVPEDGTLVKREWLRRWTSRPVRQQGDRIVQSWDTASKDGVFNDWSVCITALVRGHEVYLLDVFRKKLAFPDLLREVVDRARREQATALLVEDAASGQQVIQMLNREQPSGVPRPIKRAAQSDKVTRMSGQSSRIEAGELLLPEEAPWLADFERELIGFPSTRHDDQVDALAQLLEWTGQRNFDSGVIIGGLLIEG